jgi:hypothetical protein
MILHHISKRPLRVQHLIYAWSEQRGRRDVAVGRIGAPERQDAGEWCCRVLCPVGLGRSWMTGETPGEARARAIRQVVDTLTGKGYAVRRRGFAWRRYVVGRND